MSDEGSALPLELRVYRMLRERVSRFPWDARRVVWAVSDYRDVIDCERVAAACADWLAGPHAQRVADPHPQLRRYFEEERQRCAPNVMSLAASLRPYNRSDVRVGPWPPSPPTSSDAESSR